MAMNCSLNEDSQRVIRQVVAARLAQMVNEKSPFELNAFVQEMYDEFVGEFDHDMAIDVARLTPMFVKQIINQDTQMLKSLINEQGLVESEITNLVFEAESDEGVTFMEDYLGISEDVAATLEAMNEPEEIVEEVEPEEETSEGTAPTNRPKLKFTGSSQQAPFDRDEDSTFQAYAPTLLSDLGQEALSMDRNDPNYNVPDKDQSIYYKIKRAIIKALGLADYDSSTMDYQGKGPVYLKAVNVGQIAPADRKPGALNAEQEKAGVAMMVVDAAGKPLRFDKDGNVSETGTLAYYNLRTANKKEIYDKDGNIKLRKHDRKRAEALANMKNITQGEAEAILKRELQLIEQIRDYIKENPTENTITFKINGGSLGYSPFDWNVHTPIKDITFADPTEFDPQTVTSDFQVPGLQEGETYFILDALHGNPIVAERPAVKDTPYGEFLTSLLVDNVVDKFGVPVTNQRKQTILDNYIRTKKGDIRYFPDTGDILLYGERLKTNTDKAREEARKKLTQHFSALSPVRNILSNQINGRREIPANTPRDQWKLNDILVYPEEGGKKTYRVIEYAKIHTSKKIISGTMQDIKQMNKLDDGTVQMVTEAVSYKNFIKNHYTVHHELNAQGQIVRLNAYMTFEPTVDEMDKLAEARGEESLAKAKQTKPKSQSLADKSTEDSVAKLIQEHRDNTKLHKNLDRKVGEMKATSEQLKEAEQWYKNHPLSKYFPLEVVMNAVNQKGSAAASWSMAGITLYKGADFSDVYHEAWHAFTQAFLTREQKTDLYNEARAKTGSFRDHNNRLVTFAAATDLQLEEYLAEDFRGYMLKGQKETKDAPKRNNIFQKIWNALKALFEDSSISSMASNERADAKIKELYDKLRVGNLTEYTHSAENVQFGQLNQGIQPINKDSDLQYGLTYETSQSIVSLVDSLISEWTDLLNAVPGLTEAEALRLSSLQEQINAGKLKGTALKETTDEINSLNAKSTYKYTSTIFQTPQDTQRTYKYVLSRLAELHNELEAKREAATTSTEKAELDKTIRDIWYAIDHFGNVDNPIENATEDDSNNVFGVMAYHAKQSRYIIEEAVDLFFEEENMSETDTFLQSRRGHDKAGNENSHLELASKEVVYLLHGLFEINEETNEVERDRFGAPKLAPFTEVWNRLARALQNKPGAESMEAVLIEEAKTYAPFKQLLNKMGPLSTTSTAETNLWSKFWQTFNLTRVPLMQMTVEKIVDPDTKNVTYISKIGEASADHRKIGQKWQSSFANAIPSDKKGDPGYYILRDDEGNYLDVEKVIADFPFSSIANNVYEFYKAIGINLSDIEPIHKELDEFTTNALFYLKRLYVFMKKDQAGVPEWKIRSMQDLNRDLRELSGKQKDTRPFKITGLTGVKDFFVPVKGQGKVYKRLQELEARYSNIQNNFMVTNAEGNTQFEHSLNNTLTITTNAINYAESYQDLIAMPHMAHLDVERNPFARASVWLNSVFVMDDPTIFGQKRKDQHGEPVSLQLTNLSGVMLEEEGKDTALGVASAKADEFSKLIMDFHLNTEAHLPELMRHADKGTSFSVALSSVFSLNGTESTNYIDNLSFLDDPSSYNQQAADLLIPHINAEMQRIKIMTQMSTDPEAGPYDFNYMERGLKFVTFDDVLTASTKDEVLKQDDLVKFIESATPESNVLRNKIVQDLTTYFAQQSANIAEMMKGNEFISTSLDNLLKGEAQNRQIKSNQKSRKQALINSFVYNSWIHNVESLSVLYGDLAQYNYIKEEFHKRNAGAGSTGRVFRTDTAMKNYINQVRGRGYSDTYGGDNGYQSFDGTMASAVVRDNEIGSVYFDEYAAATGSREANPYKSKMNEGDAQGYIAFDSYRILKTTQGVWTDEHEQLYQDIVQGRPYDSTKIPVFFSSAKVQYFGPLKTTEGLPVTALHKFNLFPLIPSAIENTNLKGLHEKMMTEGIDYTLFESGSKVGTITNDRDGADELYSKGRTLSEKVFTKNIIFMEYLKDQLEIAPKYKNRVIFSTQMRKLIEDGLMENGVPTDFMKGKSADARMAAWDKLSESKRIAKSDRYKLLKQYERNIGRLTQFKKEELLRDINWKETKDGVEGSIADLMAFVQKELTRQDLADHEIKFLDTKKGKIQYDVSLSLSADKIERLLNALVTKRLVKQKVNGEGLIQVSGALFENLSAHQDRNYTNPTDEERRKWGTNDLPTYHQAKGGTAAMKVKISLQGDFIKLLDATDKDGIRIGTIGKLNTLLHDEEWLNMGNNRRMVTMVGVRIPVQGLNSMEFMEVYEFLPTEAGNIIVPPAEIVAKSGSDFDVDKLNIMMPNLATLDGKTSLISESDTGKTYDQLKADVRNVRKKIQTVRREFAEQFNAVDLEKESAKFFKKEIYPQIKDTNAKLDYFLDLQAELEAKNEKTIEDVDRLNRAASSIKALDARQEALQVQKDAFFSELDNAKINEIVANRKQALDPYYKELGQAQELFYGVTDKAIENSLIENISSILALPENFAALVRPNDVDIVRPIADDLAEYVMDFNPKDVVNGNTRTEEIGGKDVEVISPTRSLEIQYNLYKHASNNIGKQTLGLGAVDNTYNVVFNRIGARMNPTSGTTTADYTRINALVEAGEDVSKSDYKKWKNYHRQKLFLPHHTVKVGDQDAISLSHTMDAAGEHKISDVISQLINGWVDIAKDAWIFNLQGNKQVAPTLLFMIQSGVPVKDAVYLASMPMMREYVKEQQIAKSTFAEPLGKAPSNPNFFQNKARAEMLSNPKYGFNLKPKDLTPRVIGKTINDTADAQIKGKVLNKDGHLDRTRMRKSITGYAKKRTEGKEHKYTAFERAAFLHYLEIENMGKAVRDIKLRMNLDTSKSGTLFEAQNRKMMIEELKHDARIPHTIVDDILNDSPIGSFYVQPFQLQVWGDIFTLRNHDKVNEMLYDIVSSSEGKDAINSTFGNSEQFANVFRNDLPSFIFQNAVRSFDINITKSYRGHTTNSTTPISEVTSLEYGAFVEDGVLYFDKNRLKKDYATKAFAGGRYAGQGLAQVNSLAFNTPAEYYNFVFEREHLRAINPYSKVKDSTEFQQKFNQIAPELKQYKNEDAEAFLKRKNKTTYESYLRDKALDNTFNHWKIFQSEDNFAQQFLQIRDTYKSLSKDFSIMTHLSASSKRGLDITNLKLDNTSPTAHEMNVYHENLMLLAKSEEKKVLDPVDNERISEFFKRFSTVALLQSGLDTKSTFSMVRVVPQQAYLDIMAAPVAKFTTHLDWAVKKKITPQILLEFYDKFKEVNKASERAVRIRGKNYTVDLTLDDSIEMLKDPKLEKETLIERVTPETIEEVASDPTINEESGQQEITSATINASNDLANVYTSMYPKKTFIYNKAFEGLGYIRDNAFQETGAPNIVGITTLNKYDGSDMNIQDDRVNGVAQINPEVKKEIDAAIANLKEHVKSGQSLVFMREGYGQGMIGADPRKASVPNAAKQTAPKTFIYLSQQLYENFGYVNPNMLKVADGRTIVQKGKDGKKQPITDAMIQDRINKCYNV